MQERQIMKYKHLIWDFDGTLFDTYGEIAKVVKEVVENMGIKEDLDFILKNLHQSLTFTFKEIGKRNNIDYLDISKAFFLAEEEMDVSNTYPFSGTKEMIKAVSGYNFMVTNRGLSVFRFLEDKDYLKYFTEILHKESGFPLKPRSDKVDYLVDKYKLNRDEILFLGDRDLDIECANNSHVDSCYFDTHNIKNTAPATYYVKSLKEILDIIKA